jgi:hypothetical protein
MQVPNAADLRAFAGEVLGCLVEEGRASEIDYLATLSAYFAANSSSARAVAVEILLGLDREACRAS